MERKVRQIHRGEIYYADLSPVQGSEQGGIRPVLVIQNDTGNHFSNTVIVAPITSKEKGLRQPTHIRLAPDQSLPKPSIVLLEQIRTLDKSRLRDYTKRVDNTTMEQINEAIMVSLGLCQYRGARP